MKKPKDARSTGRKRARTVLFRTKRPFECATCKRSQEHRPPENPRFLDSFWPEGNRQKIPSLEANHKNKNILDNDPSNLEWLCKRCHRLWDSITLPGVSLYGDEYGYSVGITDDTNETFG